MLFENIDYCIVGAGIVGLHTALFLKKQQPTAKVLVLERALLGAAASSKNAGFACFGSVSEILDDIKTFGKETAFELIKMRWEGLQLLIKTNGAENIGLEKLGGYELFTADDRVLFEQCKAFIPELNHELSYIGDEVYTVPKSAAYPFEGVEGVIFNRFEAQIETDQMYFNLEQKAREEGVFILRGYSVDNFQNSDKQVFINCGELQFAAKNLIITNNGFAAKLLPHAQVEPARAQVLVTAPIPGFKLKGTFHYDKGYYYFRNCGDRLLIGGGRNTDFNGERTTDQKTTESIQQHIEELMYSVILKQKVNIEYRWAGTMGVGPTKYPIIEKVSDRIYCGVRMGGMGVAIGSLVAKRLVELIEGGS